MHTVLFPFCRATDIRGSGVGMRRQVYDAGPLVTVTGFYGSAPVSDCGAAIFFLAARPQHAPMGFFKAMGE
jgi:hypothetical protein